MDSRAHQYTPSFKWLILYPRANLVLPLTIFAQNNDALTSAAFQNLTDVEGYLNIQVL